MAQTCGNEPAKLPCSEQISAGKTEVLVFLSVQINPRHPIEDHGKPVGKVVETCFPSRYCPIDFKYFPPKYLSTISHASYRGRALLAILDKKKFGKE
jgi:hypothetical protein